MSEVKELADRQSRRLACGFVIDKNVSMPMKIRDRIEPAIEYPFEDMEIGDSFVVHGLRDSERARNKASLFGFNRNCKFTSRIVNHSSIRIWRVE